MTIATGPQHNAGLATYTYTEKSKTAVNQNGKCRTYDNEQSGNSDSILPCFACPKGTLSSAIAWYWVLGRLRSFGTVNQCTYRTKSKYAFYTSNAIESVVASMKNIHTNHRLQFISARDHYRIMAKEVLVDNVVNIMKEEEQQKQTTTKEEVPTMAPQPVEEDVPAGGEADEAQEEERSTKISFGSIEIREYSRCLGNNPATTHGPPLSLGWSYNIVGSLDVEEYEAARPTRREGNQMLIPGTTREDILSEQAGVTRKQMQAMAKQIKDDRHKRQMTVAMQEFEPWHIAAEFLSRRVRRISSGVSKKREQELLWENASKVQGYSMTKILSSSSMKRGSSKGTACLRNDPAYESDCDSSTVSESCHIQVAVH